MYKVGTEDWLSVCYRASDVQGGYRGLAQCLLRCQSCTKGEGGYRRLTQCLLQGQRCTRWVQRIDSVPVTVSAMYKVGTED